MALTPGDAAPVFTLKDQAGTTHQLSDYQGKWVLLYFYPKDDTPGCTAEACTLRDHFSKFGNLNAVVLGVSGDSEGSHDKFVQKYQLPFILLADPNKTVITAYDAKSTFGAKRISYLINPNGSIAKIYSKVKPEEHAAEVLADLQTLQAA